MNGQQLLKRISASRRVGLAGLVAGVVVYASYGQEGWSKLFNGSDLTGWVQRGGNAKFSVEDGVIVGVAVADTPNSFLCTESEYGDFELELEFKVDPALNSGVQIRSQCFDTDKVVEVGGKQIKVPAGRVHGYQVEIDMETPRNRLWTAGIYDEARRGWLYPGILGGESNAFSVQGLKVSKQNDWNHLRVLAVGPEIKTWLNGELRAQLTDSMTLRGFIALQVHSIGRDKAKEGLKVQFRNIRIKPFDVSFEGQAAGLNTLTEREKAEGWRLLWDGKTTRGWRSPRTDAFPERGWQIKDGELQVVATGSSESQAGGDIITHERFSDFELVVEFKLTPGCNSGIKYFVQPNLDPITGTGAKAATGSAIGLEFQILDDALHPDAKLGRNGNRTLGALYDLLPPDSAKEVKPPGEWNTARIVSRGKRVEHWLNGRKILEYDRGSPEFKKAVAQSKFRNIPGFGEWPDGHILLQEHGSQVSFRNIKIRLL